MGMNQVKVSKPVNKAADAVYFDAADWVISIVFMLDL